MSVFLLPVHKDLRDHISKTSKKETQTFLQSWHQLIDNILHCSVMAEGKGETEMNIFFFKQYALLHQETQLKDKKEMHKNEYQENVNSHLHSEGT